uniref:FIIND domain-containing protein n=1 Tax=Athene cunicularia TaxID=194338 RepID=A0A663LWI3_ATHCN
MREVRAFPVLAGHCHTQRKWHRREPGTDPGCHLGGWVCLQNLLFTAILHPPEESGLLLHKLGTCCPSHQFFGKANSICSHPKFVLNAKHFICLWPLSSLLIPHGREGTAQALLTRKSAANIFSLREQKLSCLEFPFAKYILKTGGAQLWGPGVFQCCITGLGFEVNSAVTITYGYATWNSHLSEADQEMWVPAGPLFHIEVQPGVVEAVHLPHFICLAGDVDTSLCSIAHFKSGQMALETPTRVIPFSAVLEKPNFSLLGVLWRKLRSTLKSIPAHSVVLIFHQLRAAVTTLHLYLIPDDKCVRRVWQRELGGVKKGCHLGWLQ